jgi:hypothetical protein
LTGSNRFLLSDHSGRPTRIALAIRGGRLESLSTQVGRLESLSRFTSADSNRVVDSGRPSRNAQTIQFVRLESLIQFLATRCARLSAASSFWRLAVLDFRLGSSFWRIAVLDMRLARHFGDSL